ncbi:MAG: serine/threonine protein phosphatase [Alphaproteobacteria bacterium]|nr:MAG: serine/threonine protein phosphatase [Alphaproteobacteria bacterium]
MPPDAKSPLTFAVGDIHGCLDKLNRLMAACEAHAGARPARYVFLGDYIDRGPQSRSVIEFLIGRQAAQPGTIVFDWLGALPLCHDDGLRFFVHAGVDLDVPLAEQAPEVMLWMREPFLTYCDEVDCGRFIVHGHTPLPTGVPDLRQRRLNLDTAAVMGGPLSAAVFDDTQAQPLGFLSDRGTKAMSMTQTIGRGGVP